MPTIPDPAHIAQWGAGMWNIFDEMALRPRSTDPSPEAQLKLLHNEAEVLDLFRRYHYHYDRGNVDAVMSLFADDCVVVNPRGTYQGADAIRQNYEYLCTHRKFIIHYGTNHLVRFEDDFQEAWLGAFYYSVVILRADLCIAVGGTYIDRLRREGDAWKIFEQRITANFRTPVAALDLGPGRPPAPSSPTKSSDLIEPEMVF